MSQLISLAAQGITALPIFSISIAQLMLTAQINYKF